MDNRKKSDKLVIANKEKAELEAELAITDAEKTILEDELVIANEDKAERAAELVQQI